MIKYTELTDEQKELVNSFDYDVIHQAIKNGWGVDRLVKHKDYRVRGLVAREGYCEEILREDEVGIVRALTLRHAKLSETFEMLKNDDNRFVKDAWETINKQQTVVVI